MYVASFVSLLLPPGRRAVPQPPGAPAGVSRDSFRIGHRAAGGTDGIYQGSKGPNTANPQMVVAPCARVRTRSRTHSWSLCLVGKNQGPSGPSGVCGGWRGFRLDGRSAGVLGTGLYDAPRRLSRTSLHPKHFTAKTPRLSRFPGVTIETEKPDGPLWGISVAHPVPPCGQFPLAFRVPNASVGCPWRLGVSDWG